MVAWTIEYNGKQYIVALTWVEGVPLPCIEARALEELSPEEIVDILQHAIVYGRELEAERIAEQYRGGETDRIERRLNGKPGEIYRRDGEQCRYCGTSLEPDEFQLDHVLPKSKGGGNSPDNLVTACPSCNRKKWARTPEEAGMELRTI